jgi:penicillin-binding protein 2
MLRLKKNTYHTNNQDIANYKSVLMILLIIASLSFLVYRLADLQISRRDYYQNRAESNIYRTVLEHSPRGTIYDRNGVKLAEDISSFHLYLDLDLVRDPTSFKEGLLEAVDLDPKKIEDILNQRNKLESGPILVKANLSNQEIAKFNETRFQFDPEGKGAIIREGFKRYYPQGKLLSHALGYTGIVSAEELKEEDYKQYLPDERVGKQGLEKFYENLLHGTKGINIQRIDAFGKILEEKTHKEVEKGSDIYLSIDARLQKKVEDLIFDHVGTCIIMDAQEGEILAYASYPDFDPNIFSTEISQAQWDKLLEERAFFDIAVQGTYAPGSTFKPLVALYALENNLVTSTEKITCRGFLDVQGVEGKYQCYVFPGSHGPLQMTEAMKLSCDVYFYEIAKRFPILSFLEFAKNFGGISQSTGVDLPFENTGFLGSPTYKKEYYGFPWFEGDSMNLGIGQGFLSLSPLQLTCLYSRLANGGKLIQAKFLKNLAQNSEARNLKKEKKIEKYKIKEENLKQIRNDLKAVVSPGGTAWALHSPKLKIAAKTGTAEGVKTSKGEITWDLWLAAFAPADDPKIVAVMMFENSSLEFGGNLAPLLKEAIEFWFDLSGSNGGN